MPQLFNSVPGEAGSLVFQFNGQFALKNYNVEIVNGNRLKVTSVQNEMFSLLEVDVTEVEINGTIYSDSEAAQIALQSLVYSNEVPQILTELDKTSIMAGFKGSVKKTSPRPTSLGFYLAEEKGIYTNINNIEVLEGELTFFIFNGNIWSTSVIKIPSNTAKQVFSSTDNVNTATMKAIADRYDKGRNDIILNSIKEFYPKDVELYKAAINADKSITLTGLDAGFIVKEGTLNENSEASIIYKENTASSIVFGFRALNAKHHVTCRYNTNGPNSGKLEIVAKNPLTSIKLSDAVNNNYTLGDILKLVIRRVGLTYIFQVINITKGWSLQMEQVTTPLGVPFVAHSISNPFVSAMTAGSNATVFEYRNYSNAKDIEYIIEGDSITFGQSATKEANRWASKIKGNNLVAGGGADTTGYLKVLVPEIIKVNPKRALIMMGGNDIVFNIAAEVWKQNLRDIRNLHAENGIQVIHCFPTPRPGANQLIDFIKNEPLFKFDLKIDTNTPLMNGNSDILAAIYDSGDGVHPNEAGHAKIAEIINSSINVVDPVYPNNFQSIDKRVEANAKNNFQKVIDASIGNNQTELVAYGKGTDYAITANKDLWVGNKMIHKGGVLKSIILNALKQENYKFVIATYVSDTVVNLSSTEIIIAAQVGVKEYQIPGNIVLNPNQNLFLSLNTAGKIGYTHSSLITDCEFCQTDGLNGPNFIYSKNAGYAPWMINLEVQKGRTPYSVDEMTLAIYNLINGVGSENADFTSVINIKENTSYKYTKLSGPVTFRKGDILKFGPVVRYKLTGGSVNFTSDFIPETNTPMYDRDKTNFIYFYEEDGKIVYSIEHRTLQPII